MLIDVPFRRHDTDLLLLGIVWVLLLFVGIALVGCFFWVARRLYRD